MFQHIRRFAELRSSFMELFNTQLVDLIKVQDDKNTWESEVYPNYECVPELRSACSDLLGPAEP
eukprot:CAMPEP_0196726724 /NCGR_PEP_ID=MMETSP1091-20130531/7921_1 /TAXON_ID=302021 /ORGANISM="Rhodomonas sp., Strain CCMP768" /LENGTH=63 /DNA_ID=CAMNT_0042069207 /DNA_START=145 /DNA_END=336 /DNA_ORIENTATION=+